MINRFRTMFPMLLMTLAALLLAACTITEDSITGINIDAQGQALTLAPGEGLQLAARATGSEAALSVDWHSSQADVATVDATGLVMGLAEGSTNITATSSANQNLKDSIVITVIAAEPATPVVTSVKVTPAELILVAGESSQLIASVTGSGDYADGIRWSSDAKHIATIDETGLVRAQKPGTATITANSIMGGQSAEASITVIEEPMNEAPEPIIQNFTFDGSVNRIKAGSELTISWTVQHAAELRLKTLHKGQPTGEDHDLGNLNEGTITVHLPIDLPTVNYLLTATNSSGTVVEQLLKEDGVPLSGWICSEPQQEITFHEDIADQVRQLYGLGAGQIYCEDVQKEIKSRENEFGQEIGNALSLSSEVGNPGTLSLEGLQHLSQLRRLELEHNNLTDISVLHGLSSLVELNLDNNLVSDLTPLASLHNLEVLGLYENAVDSLRGIEGLTRLRILYASNNRILDLAPLRHLTNLELLWLIGNCRDTATMTGCLKDIEPLVGLTELKSLGLALNEIQHITAIGGLTNLEFLAVDGNRISDIGALRSLPALQTVLLDDNPISSLAPLADNDDFAGGRAAYDFQRGSVRMPVKAEIVFPNLRLGYNCLSAATTEVDTITSRGASVTGASFMQDDRWDCGHGARPLASGSTDYDVDQRLKRFDEWKQERRKQ